MTHNVILYEGEIMTELEVNMEKVYTISGLTFSDIELICLGLEYISDDAVVEQRNRLVEVIDAAL